MLRLTNPPPESVRVHVNLQYIQYRERFISTEVIGQGPNLELGVNMQGPCLSRTETHVETSQDTASVYRRIPSGFTVSPVPVPA